MEVCDVFDGPVAKERALVWIHEIGVRPEEVGTAGPGGPGVITGQGQEAHGRSQLLVRCDGRGWVGSQPGEQVAVSAGQVVVWDAGEWYAAGVGEGGNSELWVIDPGLHARVVSAGGGTDAEGSR